MKIKKSKHNFFLPNFFNYFTEKFPDRTSIWIKVIFIAIYSLILIFAGVMIHKTEVIGLVIKPAIAKKANLIFDYLKGLSSQPETIAINVKHKSYMKLAYKRDIALKEGILITSDDDYVPVQLLYRGKMIDAKIRLKGDLVLDHLKGDKWSFRIVVRDDNTIMGMRKFSLHRPSARDYINEWIIQKIMRKEGVIAIRYDFVDVILNGKRLGIYAIEEHFDKNLIENNQRIEGPIVHFSEDADVKNWHHFGYPAPAGTNTNLEFFSSPIEVYRPGKTMRNPVLKQQYMLAKDLLESFRLGKVDTCDAFDCDQLATYLALLDLFFAKHALKFGSLKLYYNPITSKLEPICFDADLQAAEGLVVETMAQNWYKVKGDIQYLFFKDNRLFELYMNELARISKKEYLDQFFAEMGKQMQEKVNIIYKDYPWYHFGKKSLEPFYGQQEYIRKVLDLPIYVNAYFQGISGDLKGNKTVALNVGNIRSVPIRITAISFVDTLKDVFPVIDRDNILSPSFDASPISMKTFRFQLPPQIEWTQASEDQLQIHICLLEQTLKRKRQLWAGQIWIKHF